MSPLAKHHRPRSIHVEIYTNVYVTRQKKMGAINNNVEKLYKIIVVSIVPVALFFKEIFQGEKQQFGMLKNTTLRKVVNSINVILFLGMNFRRTLRVRVVRLLILHYHGAGILFLGITFRRTLRLKLVRLLILHYHGADQTFSQCRHSERLRIFISLSCELSELDFITDGQQE